MTLLITQNDLQPLVGNADALEEAFRLFESVFLEMDDAKNRFRTPNVELPVRGSQQAVQVNLSSSPTFGAAIRAFPLSARVNPDSHVNLLFDKDDARLLAIIAGDDVHVYRTSIPVGIAARHLAPVGGAKVLGVLGSGRQGRGEPETIIHALPGIERLVVYSPNEAHRRAYAEEVAPRLGLPVQALNSAREVMEQSDVVALTARATAPVFEAQWVKPGATLISINATQSPPELIEKARVVMGYRAERMGEPYKSMIDAGRWSADKVAASLGEVISGQRPPRAHEDDIVLADMNSAGAWEPSLYSWVYQWALKHEAGTEVHLSTHAPDA